MCFPIVLPIIQRNSLIKNSTQLLIKMYKLNHRPIDYEEFMWQS